MGYYWLSRLSTRVSKTGCHSNYYIPIKIIVHKCITDRTLPMDYQISSRPAYQPLTSLVIEPVNLVMAIGNVIEHSDEDLKGGDTNNSPSHEVPQPTSIHTGILEGTLDIYEAIITGCSCYTIAMTCGFKARTRITLHTIL